MKIKNSHISILFFIFINLSFCQISLFLWLNQNNYDFFSNTDLQLESYDNLGFSGQNIFTKQWLNNTSFNDPIEPTWFPTYGELGDKFDVNATTSPGQANYEILGETNTFSDISGTPLSSEWTRVHNPEFPLYPDTSTINSEGCYVSHTFAEGADQFPSVHWERNVSMPINMEDYIITSASLSAVVNATVSANNGGGGGIEVPGDPVDDAVTYDYVRFYVLFSDLTGNKVYEVAYNQTIDLGKDSAGSYDYMTDTFMTIVPEEILIFYLTSVISSDFQNFIVTLGIRIWCEDNWVSDQDIWDDLLIKSCNLMFTYERKIDQFTSLSWNQDAGKVSDISNDAVIVNEAKLYLKYKIDQLWPVASSPNSEIRFFINDNPHTETIKLSSANTSFQEAKVGGFDVTSLITDDVNLSIQVYLVDEFLLDRKITVSIDDVYLNITYTVTFLDIGINTPENKTYTSPDSGYYPTTYGFENEVDGTSRTDIAYVDSTNNIQSNCYVDIVNNFQGHNKVLRIYDANTAGNAEARNHFTSPQQSGTIEWWWSTSASGSNMIDYLFYEGILGTGVGKLKMEDDNYLDMQDNIVQSYIANRWYHHRIEFDAASDTYNWSIDGVLRVNNGNFLTPVSNIGTMNINADWASYGNCYVDAIGYSWDPNYDVGDNLNEGLLLSYENKTNLDWKGYSLDGVANKTILGNTTIPMPSDGLHSIQVFGNDTMGTTYESTIRHFSVDTTPPELSITYPSTAQEFSDPPAYILSVTEENIASMWYTLNGGANNPITSETGTIDSFAWNSLPNGPITIRFYVRDIADREVFNEVVVKVAGEEPPIPPGIPGYNLYLLLGALSIISALVIRKRVKS